MWLFFRLFICKPSPSFMYRCLIEEQFVLNIKPLLFLWLRKCFQCYQKNIYEIIHFNESTCDIYTMDYISQSPTHCSKYNLQCVLQCTKFTHKQNNGLIFQKNWSSIKQRYMKLGDGLQKKRSKNNLTCPMFDNDFLASSNQMKLCTTYYIFTIK